MADAEDRLDSLTIQYPDDLFGHLLESVRLGFEGLVRAAISQQIRSNDPITFTGEVDDLIAPVVGRGGKAMDEEDIWMIPASRSNMNIAIGCPIAYACGLVMTTEGGMSNVRLR